MKLLVINGPNLNLLGTREPAIYGSRTLAELEGMLLTYGAERGVALDFFQSNHEGALIDRIHAAMGCYNGLIINPAAYTHTSIAIPDAIKAVGIPTVEVHLSDIAKREPYRRHSYTAPACLATISGQHFEGYLAAVDLLLRHVNP